MRVIFRVSLNRLLFLEFTRYLLLFLPEDILNQEFLQTRALCKFSTEFLGC